MRIYEAFRNVWLIRAFPLLQVHVGAALLLLPYTAWACGILTLLTTTTYFSQLALSFHYAKFPLMKNSSQSSRQTSVVRPAHVSVSRSRTDFRVSIFSGFVALMQRYFQNSTSQSRSHARFLLPLDVPYIFFVKLSRTFPFCNSDFFALTDKGENFLTGSTLGPAITDLKAARSLASKRFSSRSLEDLFRTASLISFLRYNFSSSFRF